MLEGLDSIRWNELEGADNNIVPELLKAIASSESDVSSDALSRLSNNVNHQDTLYETSPYVVPFLVELLNSPSIHHKERILRLIGYLAASSTEAISEGCSIDYADLAISTYKNIEAGFTIYCSLITNKNPLLRKEIYNILGYLCRLHDEILEFIYLTYDREDHLEVKFQIVQSVIRLLETSLQLSSYLRKRMTIYRDNFFKDIFASIDSIVIQIEAAKGMLVQALAIGGLEKKDVKEAQQFLIDRITDTELHLPLRVELLRFLARQTEDISLLLATIIEKNNIDLFVTHEIVKVLMDKVFVADMNARYGYRTSQSQTVFYDASYGKISDNNNITSRRAEVLQAILNCEQFWQLPTNVFSFFYGLPDSREELQALIEKS